MWNASFHVIVVHGHVGHVQSKTKRWRAWMYLGVVHSELGILTMFMKMFNKFPHKKPMLLLL